MLVPTPHARAYMMSPHIRTHLAAKVSSSNRSPKPSPAASQKQQRQLTFCVSSVFCRCVGSLDERFKTVFISFFVLPFFFFSITSWFCGIVYPPLLLAARPPTVRAHITLLCLSCALLFLYYSPFLSLIILSIWMKQLFFFPSCLIFIININIWRFFFSTECVYTHSGGSLSAIGGSFQENGLCTMHNRGQNAHNRR